MACIMGQASGSVISDLTWIYLMLACIEFKCHGHLKLSLQVYCEKLIYGIVNFREI